jgi:mitotic spindle assembly checkpoint protein MAD1
MQLETRIRDRDATIERLDADRRLLAEREQEERVEKERVSKEHDEEKVSGHTITYHFTMHILGQSCDQIKAEQDIRSLRSALSTLQEDHADLNDKYDALSHTTTQKLAAQAADLTARERQVESLSAELHSAHEAAATHSAEVLRLQSALDVNTTTQTDITRHEAEEASWSVLRAELTRQAERSRHLETSRARVMAELNTLRERHTAMEVLREEKRAFERRAEAADELRDTVVRLEAEVEAARAEREAWCVSLRGPHDF